MDNNVGWSNKAVVNVNAVISYFLTLSINFFVKLLLVYYFKNSILLPIVIAAWYVSYVLVMCYHYLSLS